MTLKKAVSIALDQFNNISKDATKLVREQIAEHYRNIDQLTEQNIKDFCDTIAPLVTLHDELEKFLF